LCSYLAFYFAFFGYFFVGIRRKLVKTRISVLITLSCLWVVLEYIRGYLFTGFPWALLGYSQYLNITLIQIADIIGGLGVSFIVIFVNLSLFEIINSFFIKEYSLCRRIILIVIAVFIIVIGYGWWAKDFFIKQQESVEKQQLKVTLIQGNIPQEQKWLNIFREKIKNKYLGLTKKAIEKDEVDLVVWPETSFPDYVTDRESIELLHSFSREIEKPLLFGAVYDENETYFNGAFLIPKRSDNLHIYKKIHLVPFGEYVPLRRYLSFLADLLGIADFTKGRDFTIFPINNKYDKMQHFGVLICFEDIFPDLSRQFRLKGADFLINITNDAWFKKTSSPYQHMQASVFRAIENRIYLARAANTGVSCVIDNLGRVVAKIEGGGTDIFVEGSVSGIVKKSNFVSFYTKYGDVFTALCCLYLVIFSLIVSNYPFLLRKSKK